MTVIPDSIEPYLGYKALVYNPSLGLLESPHYNYHGGTWFPGERLSARCPYPDHFRWEAVKHEPKPFNAETLTDPFLTGIGVMGMGTGATGPSAPIEPPRKPKTILPSGWEWSWEPQPHEIASEFCYCGIYVANSILKAREYLHGKGVIVEVALWGTVTKHGRGARGQYAYPQRIVSHNLKPHQAEQIAEQYQIKLDVRTNGPGAPYQPTKTGLSPGLQAIIAGVAAIGLAISITGLIQILS